MIATRLAPFCPCRETTKSSVAPPACCTPPRLSEPPEGDSLDVVPPMDLNSLLYLRKGELVSSHDKRPYPDTPHTHRAWARNETTSAETAPWQRPRTLSVKGRDTYLL